jgi:hypothetical protein
MGRDADRTLESTLIAGYLHAKFLALREEAQGLEGEFGDWNRKKADSQRKPRRWKKKRLLIPPAAKQTAAPRPAGAQPCNTNRLKHGRYERRLILLRAMIRAHIHAGEALIGYAKYGVLGKAALRSVQSKNRLLRVA